MINTMAYDLYSNDKIYIDKKYPLERIFSQDIRYDADDIRFRLHRDVQEYIGREVQEQVRQLLPTLKESLARELKPALKLEVLKELGSERANANLDF